MEKPPRIALFDIETAPIKGYAWTIFDTNLIWVEEPSFIMSYSMKWLGDDKIRTRALPDFPAYRRNKKNDKFLVQEIRDFLHEADIVIAHNGDSFDIKKVQARLVVHSIEPPSPFKSIDTLKASRKYFKLDSNKLDNLARTFDEGKKLPHTGSNLWEQCLKGDAAAWRMMKAYNEHDVVLLERVYERIRPYIANHPNVNAYKDRPIPLACPACQSPETQGRGVHITKTSKRSRHQCKSCGHWFLGEIIREAKPGNVSR